MSDETPTPKPYEEMFERCVAETLNKDFPDKDLRDLWTTDDAERRRPPAEELADFVFRRCRIEATEDLTPEGINPAAIGAEHLLREALARYGDGLSRRELALLHAMHAILLRQIGPQGHYDSASKNEHRRRVETRFLKAIDLVKEAGLPLRSVRQLKWLTAETMINGGVNDTNRGRIRTLLIEACAGGPYSATRGIYFNTLSRLIWLCEEQSNTWRESTAEALRPALYAAWASIPVGVLPPRKKQADELPQEGMVTVADVTNTPSSDKDDDGEPSTPEHAAELLAEIKYEPEDRFAICGALSYFDRNRTTKDIYGWEAKALIAKMPLERRTVAPTLTAPLWKWVDALTIHRSPVVPFNRLQDLLGKEVGAAIDKGQIAEVLLYLELKGRSAPQKEIQLACRLWIAAVEGETRSAATEEDHLLKVKNEAAEINSSDGTYVEAMATLFLARVYAASARGAAALREIDRAYALAGRIACPELAIHIWRDDIRTRNRLMGIRICEDFFHAQLFWWAAPQMWGHIGWIEKHALPTRGLFRTIQPENIAGPQELWEEVSHLDLRSLGDSDVEALRRVAHYATQMDGNAHPLRWLLALIQLHGRLAGAAMRIDNPKLRQVRRSVGTALLAEISPSLYRHLCNLFMTRLGKIRGLEARTRGALVLAEWMHYQQLKGPRSWQNDDLKRILRILWECLEWEAIAVDNAEVERDAAGHRQRLRWLIEWLSRLAYPVEDGPGLTPVLAPEQCGFCPPDRKTASLRPELILDACKTCDADDAAQRRNTKSDHFWQKDKSASISKSPFAFEESDRQFAETQHWNAHGRLCTSGQAVLSFFLAGSHSQTGLALTHTRSVSFVIVTDVQGSRICLLPRLSQSLEALMLSIKGDRKKKVPLPALVRSIRELLSKAPDTDELAAVQQRLVELGRAMFPDSLIETLQHYSHLLLVPDDRLFQMPLHMLPISERARLIDRWAVSYLPRSSYGLKFGKPANQEQRFVCVNDEVEGGFGAIGKELCSLDCLKQCRNHWSDGLSADAILDKVAKNSLALFFAHGWVRPDNADLNRLSLKDGIRLSSLDVLAHSSSFKDTHVLLMACNSANANVQRSREMMGVLPAFLRRGVRAITGSLWEADPADAVGLAKCILTSEAGATWAFQEFLSSASSELRLLEAFVRFGCFIHYGRE